MGSVFIAPTGVSPTCWLDFEACADLHVTAARLPPAARFQCGQARCAYVGARCQ